MIDWYGVFANSLWIMGLSFALATFSYASWQASLNHERTLTRLRHPEVLIAFSLSALLFCAGLAATSDTIFEIVIWSILGLLSLIQVYLLLRQRRTESSQHSQSSEEQEKIN
jgi:hypothetical protein